MRLLIIGSMKGHATAAAKLAFKRGAKVSQVDDIDSALATLRAGRGADLIMVDLTLDIADLIEKLESERICIPVVACGVNPDPDAAVKAIKAGAKEYIPLPPDAELISAVLEAVTQDDRPLLCRDPEMLKIVQMADRIAPSEASVLVTGESGTGKEVMAHYIHLKSKRAKKAFISVNCAAIPEALLESELFGHEKGSFTGAVAQRIGKFEEADGGTLLLDEISEMDPRLQAKLLRAIQEKVIDRVGGTKPVSVDIRIIATSNRDLQESVQSGQFREDLYFRLNVVNIHLAPLRERPLDIDHLANHFIKKYAALNDIKAKPLTNAAVKALQMHQWRGNIRELENTIHRALLLVQGDQIDESDLFPPGTVSIADQVLAAAVSPANSRGIVIGSTVAEVERDLILGTLDHCLGNRTHAANILGISIRTLRNKLREYADQERSARLAYPSAQTGA